ncbi:Solute carrier family 38 member [Seminavis robusta]|uniref:Solute carrier family 38 member n=1 Tax=Seminavis robusta TaxID=568900 RepID=A0A9N8EAQ6_9STRA|nr:Solute carrier family 38 member [Seminavis robusta]|eukprot:Sro851_g210920.1 Solute carrier family 38 member (592) ;mRNA; r:35769-37723
MVSTKSNRQTALRLSLFMGYMLAATHSFNLPAQKRLQLKQGITTTTTLGLQRSWIERFRGRRNGKVVVNQSSYVMGQQQQPGMVDGETLLVNGDVNRRRVQLESQWQTAVVEVEAPPELVVEEEEEQETAKGATVTSSTMNLIKVILGTGVLALPNGLAAVSDHPVALLPACALMSVLGLFSAYTFQLYGRLTHETQAKSMGEIWEETVGKKSSWVISASTFAFCFGCAVTYSLVIGDFLSSLALSLGSGVPAMFAKRQFWILGITLSTLAPLCSLKSLAALAPMSIVGTAGTLLTTFFMAFRCPALFASSPYSVAPGAVGKFAAAAAPALAPQFNTFSKIISPASLIIAAMATTAYLGHFNAPDLYHGFKKEKTTTTEGAAEQTNAAVAADKKESEKALQKYSRMTSIGFVGVTLWNLVLLSLGFLTFGGNCAGVVLNNYATADKGAVLSRLLMAASVIGSYPFMVRACKSTFVQLYSDIRKVKSKSNMESKVGRALLAIVTSLSLLVSDAGLVVSLNGALLGSAIIYIFPALMFLAHTGNQVKAAGGVVSRKLRLERWASKFLVAFGAVSGLVGAAVTLINSFAPHLLR